MSRRRQDPQAALKSRLKKLYTLPANQVCADCPERSPRWVTIIKIPPGQQDCELFSTNGAPHTAGCFMCLECSGSHRRLGVHIGFVRSVNLDSWKEEEVLALERSGSNDKVNHYYMAEHPGQQKQGPMGPDGKVSRFLSQSANGSERERFIREKYDKRRWFNPNGSSGQTFVQPAAAPVQQRANGTASQAAKERAAKMRRVSWQQNAQSRAPAPAPRAAPAPPPAAAPVVDLLDFSAAPVAAPAPAPAQQPQQDLFAVQAPQPPAQPQQNGGFDAFAGGGGFQQAPAAQPVQVQVQQNGFGSDPFGQPQQQQQQQQQPQPPQPPQPPKASNDAILSMYSAPQQNGMAADPFGAMSVGGGMGGGMAANGMNMGGMGMMGGGNPQQQQQQMLMMRQQQQHMQMQQQRMMMQGGGMNGGMQVRSCEERSDELGMRQLRW
ncbi:hypothetical protein TL16_g03702 [Triparma laevis f. inornata]|uniref:Arf-GAP domain-containing protein n=1 Tax=Triparma laevis f. inornata TaxID=1714386 RepID=A0A9W7E5N5_9STRA|nr:hypothetical protein TL16_g03702 [Triparma laevis f. inornata]